MTTAPRAGRLYVLLCASKAMISAMRGAEMNSNELLRNKLSETDSKLPDKGTVKQDAFSCFAFFISPVFHLISLYLQIQGATATELPLRS